MDREPAARRASDGRPAVLIDPEAIGLAPRRRSVGYIEHDGASWACFLVTQSRDDGRWCGGFSFRTPDGAGGDEIRTADIFIEDSEAELDHKARGLGRPLLAALLASALASTPSGEDDSPHLRRRFRQMLAEHSSSLDGAEAEMDADEALGTFRSLYASYRLDQVAHLIALVAPDDFERTVETLLDARSVDFSSRDRLQFAMLVVDQLERLLPLPPFEVWLEDFLAHREAYRLYAHTLYRERRLP